MTTRRTDKMLPAAPLVRMIDRVIRRAGGDLTTTESDGGISANVLEQLTTSQKRVYMWRRPGARVHWEVADRVISHSPYLWYEVYEECPRGPEHQVAVQDGRECQRCATYEQARRFFAVADRAEAIAA